MAGVFCHFVAIQAHAYLTFVKTGAQHSKDILLLFYLGVMVKFLIFTVFCLLMIMFFAINLGEFFIGALTSILCSYWATNKINNQRVK